MHSGRLHPAQDCRCHGRGCVPAFHRCPRPRDLDTSEREAGPLTYSSPFIKRPIATSLLMAAIFLVGLVGLSRCCRWRRCRRWTSRPSRSPRSSPAPAPRPWPPSVAAAAGDAVRADPRRRADDLDQRARATADHAAVRPRPQHRRRGRTTCRRRSTPPAASCRRTCRARRPTARSTRPTRRS